MKLYEFRYGMIALTIAIAAILSSCASIGNVVTTGVVVHNLPTDVLSRSFYILPDADSSTSLEHSVYAQDVATALIAKGMKQGGEKDADYLIRIAFGINDGVTQISGTSSTGVTCDDENDCDALELFGQKNSIKVNVTKDRYYKRVFSLTLIDRDATRRAQNKPQRVYEAKATSTGDSNSFMAVSKCIINAVMQNFPGKSGSTFETLALNLNCTR